MRQLILRPMNEVSRSRRERLVALANYYALTGPAQNTNIAHYKDWVAFQEWCANEHLVSMPAEPETVRLYITYLAEDKGLRVSTIQRHMMSISYWHKEKKHESPIFSQSVKATWKGIRRKFGVAKTRKSPIRVSQLRRMVQLSPDNLLGLRDRALLLIGFSGAFRRSEIVNLNLSDIEFTEDGIRVTLRSSKTDQEAEGRLVAIPYGSHKETCPVRTLRSWIAQAKIEGGPLFRRVNKAGKVGDKKLSDKTVVRIVKKYTEAIGLDQKEYSGHSLRAGFATSAAEGGASERSIAKQTGHRSLVILRGYIREADAFKDNAASYTGL